MILAAVLGTFATSALALDPPVIAEAHADAGGQGEAVLLFTNDGTTAATLPPQVDATLRTPGGDRSVRLQRTEARADVPAGGYVRARYRFALPDGLTGALTLDGRASYALAAPAAATPPVVVAAAEPAPPPAPPGAVAPPPRPGNPLLGNLSTYNPIYGVMGGGTNTNAKLELSFKYQLFGRAGDPDGGWLNGFHFAYTQRMFWDTAADSQPFRDVNYQPELLYFYTLPKNAHGDQLSVRGGFLHESNGRDGDASRGYNILYVQPNLDVPIGGWTASIGPRIFKYVIGRDDNPDIARYRGHQALAFSIGQQDGLKLSTWSRMNFRTGKGAVDADLSYPLTRLWHDLPLFVIVQGFTGYGEDLLDYDRKQSRLRVGIGIVR